MLWDDAGVPEPMSGLVAVAEFGSKFEADAAVAQLQQAGIDATPSYDPALNSVASYMASDRVVEVVVRDEDAAAALSVLRAGGDELPPEFTEEWVPVSRQRVQAKGCVIVSLVVALLMIVTSLLLFAGR